MNIDLMIEMAIKAYAVYAITKSLITFNKRFAQ